MALNEARLTDGALFWDLLARDSDKVDLSLGIRSGEDGHTLFVTGPFLPPGDALHLADFVDAHAAEVTARIIHQIAGSVIE